MTRQRFSVHGGDVRIEDIKKGCLYVGKNGYLIREIVNATEQGDVYWRAYSLPQGDPIAIQPHRCSKAALARWAERQATSEEVARLQMDRAVAAERDWRLALVQAALSDASDGQLLDEARRRGLDLAGRTARARSRRRRVFLDPLKLIKNGCTASVPGQLPRFTREELEAAVSPRDGAEMLELGAVDLSFLDLRGMDLRRVSFEDWSEEGGQWIGACLQGADLESVDLESARLGCANLRQAHLAFAKMRHVGLAGADLEEAVLGGADLRGSILLNANLRNASVWRTNLEACDLRYADLRDAHIVETSIRGACLQQADLSNLDLARVGAGALRGISLHRAKLDHTIVRSEDLGPALGEELAGEYAHAREAYLALKRNFEDLGDYDAASWSYVKERQMEKACSAPWRARRFHGRDELGDGPGYRVASWHPRVWCFYARHTMKWLGDWIVELVCGYGESIARVMGCIVALFLVVAPVVISSLGGIGWTSDHARAYLGMPTAWQRFWYVYDTYLVYSLDLLTTASYSGLTPTNDAVRIASGMLTLLAICLTGLLGFVAANRIRRS